MTMDRFDRNVLLVNCGSSYFAKLHEAIAALVAKVVVVSIDELESVDLNTFDAAIISGSPKQFVEIDTGYYVRKANLLIARRIPLLGICFGHQLLGLCFGAKIFQEHKRTGDESIVVQHAHALFNGLPSSFIQQEFHREHITLPSDFLLLASSKRTEVEAMVHAELPFFGVQFHPEISGADGALLLKNFFSFVF